MNQAGIQPTPPEWDAMIATLPNPHLLQTTEWAKSKAQVGWKPVYLVWGDDTQGNTNLHVNNCPPDTPIRATALILERSVSLGGFAPRLRILYAPKGPLLDWTDTKLRQRVITDLQSFARQRRAIFLKIDPDIPLNVEGKFASLNADQNVGNELQDLLRTQGWLYSEEQIQFRNTMLLDLSISEDELLARMKQKTRYNIRLASRKGVTIRTGNHQDYSMLYRMYAETSTRDGFTIRDETYYQNVWSLFTRHQRSSAVQPYCQPLIAEVDREPVAALILFMFAGKAWYLYGMSRDTHREKMPNYLLQWEAICLSKAAGCRVYDLWGAPEVMDSSDPLWGVYRFKEGLGGHLIRFLGAWDYPVQSIFYKLYTQTMPRLLAIMRRGGQARTRHIAG